MSEFIDLIDPHEFDTLSTEMRSFFKSRGLLEVPTQHRVSILSACEDPKNLMTFSPFKESNDSCDLFSLNQTGQMWLEYEILTRPNNAGYFCYTTSYRREPNPTKGRHNLIFPMFEFEIHGGMDKLIGFEKDLLTHLGYDPRYFMDEDYLDIVEKFKPQSYQGNYELSHADEMRLYEEYSPTFFLKNFPVYTSPFWNMKIDTKTQTAKKIDVILHGIETFGSAERSCDKDEMRKMFSTISNGEYSQILYKKFGRDRVEKELENFLSLDFIPRSGCGIGCNRLLKSMSQIKNIIE